MDILEKLKIEIPNLPKKLAISALYALDNPDRIALDSMRASAAMANVTPTTMLRLARQLGFASYDDFKLGFQNQLLTTGFSARAGELRKKNQGDETESLAEQIRKASIANIDMALSDTNLESLPSIVSALRDARNCYLVGSGSLFWIANIMKTTGSMVLPSLKLVGSEFAVAAEGMSQIGPDDVAICFGINPYAKRTLDALRYVEGKGALTIAFTDKQSSPLAQIADYTLYANTQSPHYYPSTLSLIALVETLLASIVAQGGENELRQLREFERHRKASASYVEF